jgi:hypothetical protein
VNASPPGFFDDGEWRENLGLQGTYEHRMMLILRNMSCPNPNAAELWLAQLELGERAAGRIEQAVLELHAARIATRI